MHALLRLPYEFVWRAANALAPVVPSSGNKILRTLKSRVELKARIDAWAGAHRDLSRPLLWMHASSVGESLQALPVLNLFRERSREVQIVFTFYSPSAETATRNFPADFVSYLPFDTAASMRHLIESLKPTALVFSKLDVWPTLVAEARSAGVRTGIISGTLHSDSGRSSTIASLLLRDTYAALDSVGAVSAEDRANIVELGAHASRVTVTGDTRYDQVWARRQRDGPVELLDHLRTNRPTIVAGSTWQSDEVHLLKSFAKTRKNHRRLRLIIAPHEPTAGSIESIISWSNSNSFTAARLDDPTAADADLVIVDRLGVLGDLYALADIAYVGGGFHRAGLHSVLEPAAFGKPVLFGAPYGRSREAELLVSNSGARAIADASELTAVLTQWLTDSSTRTAAGSAAEQVVKRGLGAAEASYSLITKLLEAARL
ncbi:MAG: hypothetical protein H0U64_04675 [Gemmatimonadaceae bacterium]|nr:hypothetical protein [Gemmatimonadaceae bacterium]